MIGLPLMFWRGLNSCLIFSLMWRDGESVIFQIIIFRADPLISVAVCRRTHNLTCVGSVSLLSTTSRIVSLYETLASSLFMVCLLCVEVCVLSSLRDLCVTGSFVSRCVTVS